MRRIMQRIRVWQGDITTLDVDAIVNAATEIAREVLAASLAPSDAPLRR